jgi:hypothetical protein
MSDGVVLTEESFATLYRVVHEQKRSISNLRRRLTEFGMRRPQGNSGPPPDRIKFRNGSGETIPGYACMTVTSAEYHNGELIYVTGKPSTTIQRVYLVNRKNEVPASGAGSYGYGRWLFESTGPVLYDDTVTPAYGEEWGPQDGTWTIRKGHWGFVILGGNTGTGANKRTAAHQYVNNELIGKPDGAISKGSSGTISAWRRNESTNAWEDSFLNFTGTALGAALTASKYISAGWRNGEWLAACWET